MKWLLIIVAAILLGAWLYNIRQIHIRNQRQQLRITEITRLIMPLMVKVYNQLTEEIRNRWPYITFEFPTLDDLLAKSRSSLLAYDGQDAKRLTKRLLNPVVLKTVADFIAYRPDFILAGHDSLTITPMSFPPQDDQPPSVADVRNPPDWAIRRRLAYDRDRGRCRSCGVIVHLEKCHIHHIVRRARGGGHSVDNLVTLCRDCHGLMPEHEKVTGGPFYVHSHRRTLHAKGCYHAMAARQVTGSLPVLIAQGYEPCQKCLPSVQKILWIERFARGRLSLFVSSLA